MILWVNFKSYTLYPPVSVFDTKQGYWQKRKREWKESGLQSDTGRDTGLLGKGLENLAQKQGNNLTGTSIFDPVLCEIVYKWFCVDGGTVYDPFAGGSVRGIVAEKIGLKYIGIDLSQRQVDANQINADKMKVCPVWICDDSTNVDKYLTDESIDIVFSCPPYHNLEKYSNHPLDLSNMNYTDFITAYRQIIHKACNKLKQNRFAVFVVGDVRDGKGAYRDFISDTKKIFINNGLSLYNEIILLEQYGTRALTAGGMFKSKKKVAKVHQNVLVFYKGDINSISKIYKNNFKWEALKG